MRILDWGDSSISHPFASLFVTFRFLEEITHLSPDDAWFPTGWRATPTSSRGRGSRGRVRPGDARRRVRARDCLGPSARAPPGGGSPRLRPMVCRRPAPRPYTSSGPSVLRASRKPRSTSSAQPSKLPVLVLDREHVVVADRVERGDEAAPSRPRRARAAAAPASRSRLRTAVLVEAVAAAPRGPCRARGRCGRRSRRPRARSRSSARRDATGRG